MSEGQLGTGENLYFALEAGYDVVADGPLEGVSLHVPRADPNWALPESEYYTSNKWTDVPQMNEFIEEALAKAQETGAAYVPEQMFKYFQQQILPQGDYEAAYDTTYLIKGISFNFPYQMQRVIEVNVGRALVSAYRNPDISSTFRHVIIDKLITFNLSEMRDFFKSIDARFDERVDRSRTGTLALADEIERLTAQVMNDRWEVLTLPPGSDDYVNDAESDSKSAPSVPIPSQEEVSESLTNLVDAIGSERILRWGLGPTLDGLDGYTVGKATFSGTNNPFEQLRELLIEKHKQAKGAAADEIRGLLRQLQDLGDIRSRHQRSR